MRYAAILAAVLLGGCAIGHVPYEDQAEEVADEEAAEPHGLPLCPAPSPPPPGPYVNCITPRPEPRR